MEVVVAVLNHSPGIVRGIAAIYNRHRYEREKREALYRRERIKLRAGSPLLGKWGRL